MDFVSGLHYYIEDLNSHYFLVLFLKERVKFLDELVVKLLEIVFCILLKVF